MPIGDKTKNTYEKATEFFKKRADKEWAKAKDGEGGCHYDNARISYVSADRAKKGGENK